MRVLLTSAGLETVEIQNFFMDMINKDMAVKKPCLYRRRHSTEIFRMDGK